MTMPPIKRISRDEMLKHVAVFDKLEGKDNSFPEYGMPEYARRMYNVIGFKKPADEKTTGGDKVVIRPVGETLPVIEDNVGFGLLYLEQYPGTGVGFHNHDTCETFIVMSGRWRFDWNGTSEDYNNPDEQIVLGPLDVIAFPPGVSRRFQNIEGRDGKADQPGMLMGVVAGDSPAAEYGPDLNRRIHEFLSAQTADAKK